MPERKSLMAAKFKGRTKRIPNCYAISPFTVNCKRDATFTAGLQHADFGNKISDGLNLSIHKQTLGISYKLCFGGSIVPYLVFDL